MKKFLLLILIIVMALGCFVSCKNYDENKAPPTNEELITERIETFLTAYNTGDMEAVLECLDAKTRNAFQAILNMLGGLAGSAAGFDIDLKDLFSLGVSTTQGDFMELEITNINVIDSLSATATTIMKLTGAGTQTIYFEMVYENDGWYIHDMTDRKPGETNDNQNNDANTGESTDTDDDINNDGNTSVLHNYKINTCEPFVDGRAWVEYYENNENDENEYHKTYYYGFIDMQGNVLYSILADGVEIYNIGKGSAIVSSESKLALIDENGEVKMELNGHAEVKEYGGGFAWIYQNKSTITSLEHLYGVVNHIGEWVQTLENLQEPNLFENIRYIGDGFVRYREDGAIYHVWNPNVSITLNGIFSDCNIEFNNGMAFVSRSIHYTDTLSVTVTTNEGTRDENTQVYEIIDDCIIFSDGRVIDVGSWLTKLNFNWTFYDGKVVTNEKILLNNEQYYQITDYTKTTPITIELTTYPASLIEDFVFNGDYGLIQIRGLDEEIYVTMIDVKGNELITPIKGMYLDEFVLAPNGYVYYRKDNVYHIVDKNDNVIKTDISGYVSFDGNDEVGIISNYFDGISYIKPNGESLFENLTIK